MVIVVIIASRFLLLLELVEDKVEVKNAQPLEDSWVLNLLLNCLGVKIFEATGLALQKSVFFVSVSLLNLVEEIDHRLDGTWGQ